MAVAFDSLCPDTASAANVSTLTSGSWTPAAGAAFGFIGTGAGTPTTHTVMKYGGSGGTSLTQVGTTLTIGSFGRLSAWRSTITAGSTTSYGQWGASQDESCIGMVSYTGADGTVSAATTNTGTFASSTSFTPTVNVTTTAGDTVIACVWWLDINSFAGTIAAGSGCTARYDVQGSVLNAEGMMIIERVATGASTTMSATVTAASGMSGDWGIIAFVITPSAGGGGGGTEVLQQLSAGTNRNRPGRGPYSLGKYYRPRIDAYTEIFGRLTGQSITSGQGTLTPAISIALTGQAISSAQGTVAPDASKALTGQAVTSGIGTIVPSLSLSITGQSITLGQGTVSAGNDINVALTGQSITSGIGTLTPALSKALTGGSITFGQGTVSAGNDVTVALSGQGISSAQGSIASALAKALTGSAITGGQGSVTAGQGVVVSLTGQSINSGQGAITGSMTVSLNGQVATIDQGFVTSSNGRIDVISARTVHVDQPRRKVLLSASRKATLH